MHICPYKRATASRSASRKVLRQSSTNTRSETSTVGSLPSCAQRLFIPVHAFLCPAFQCALWHSLLQYRYTRHPAQTLKFRPISRSVREHGSQPQARRSIVRTKRCAVERELSNERVHRSIRTQGRHQAPDFRERHSCIGVGRDAQSRI
ncbi:hypothetical protein EXIGLDRAFT_730818 [Exidia glandulosa HHB12029]|uniref:Uncharacterized protein n=1 Tax=Exidia glandulosa HHB12029 TaxID=1314781 RepID=A0A165C188_EXIGL|nr:hypothetical protein EXIGLDRAFT_730818 [Exidia glandulosa HHB12029]